VPPVSGSIDVNTALEKALAPPLSMNDPLSSSSAPDDGADADGADAADGTERARGASMVEWAAGLVAAALGLWYGYDFGERLSGTVLGVVTALSTALFGFLLASSLAERFFSTHRRGDGESEEP
jgi:hypothetical protein